MPNPIRIAIFRNTKDNTCCKGCHESVSQCNQFRNECRDDTNDGEKDILL